MQKIADRAQPMPDALRFDIYATSLGLALIAASEQGVCAIMFGDDYDCLQSEFRRRFNNAIISHHNASGRELASRVLAIIESQTVTPPPLDIRGTQFQKRVWLALLGIPAGSTISYKELASRIEASRSIRAVAGACAANPLAPVVPCHRVVRHDGALSGYRWGLARKQALLEREGAIERFPV